MDKNESSIRHMIIVTIIAGILVFIGVFAIAFNAINIDNNKNTNTDTSKNVNTSDLASKEITASIYSFDKTKGDIKLYNYKDKKVISDDFVVNSATKYMDKDNRLSTIDDFNVGMIVSVAYTENSGIISRMQLSNNGWSKKEITDFSLDNYGGTFTLDGKKYTLDKHVSYTTKGTKTDYKSFLDDNIIISAYGYDEIILALDIVSYTGNIKLEYDSNLNGATVQIGNDKIVNIEDVENINLKPGDYNLVITKKGIDEITTKAMVVENEITKITLDNVNVQSSLVTIKSNYTNFTMSVKNSSGTINTTYTDTAQSDNSDMLLLLDNTLTLPYDSYVIVFNKTGYESITRKVTIDSETKLISISFMSDGSTTSASKVKLTINTEPDDASIYINGDYKGTGKVTASVAKGEETIVKVTKSGYQTIERTLTIEESKEYNFVLTNSNVYESPSGETTVNDDVYQTN